VDNAAEELLWTMLLRKMVLWTVLLFWSGVRKKLHEGIVDSLAWAEYPVRPEHYVICNRQGHKSRCYQE